VLRVRRKQTAIQRLERRGRELAEAASSLDIPWARSWLATRFRELFLPFVLKPLMDFYTRRRATGRDKLSRLRGPVILVANHRSHMDTPVILAALPRRFRKKTVVAAAADYFYGNKVLGALVSLVFNTVPMDRCGGGLDRRAAGHLDRLLDEGWNLLVFPEGTRSRNGAPGRLRRGAAVLARRHHLPIVPIRVTGTRDAMPPGRFWPSRLRGQVASRRHRVNVAFGDPIISTDDPSAVIQAVQRYFEGSENGHFELRTTVRAAREP
jgi:1-acyl-sn-glycerol-3-phosphate acyltransferase